jgi:hypothetical protein
MAAMLLLLLLVFLVARPEICLGNDIVIVNFGVNL